MDWGFSVSKSWWSVSQDGDLTLPFLLLITPRRLEVLFVFYRKGTRAFHVNQCVIRWLKFACLLREILLKPPVLTCCTVFSTYFGDSFMHLEWLNCHLFGIATV